MRKIQTIGLLLWRGGWLLAWTAGALIVARSFLAVFDLPSGVVSGLALAGGGALLVFVSLIWERIADLRGEGEEEP